MPRRFEADPEVLRAFKGFQTGCVVSLKKAASEREAMAAAKVRVRVRARVRARVRVRVRVRARG